jgi:hypothetical protein
VKKCGSIYVTEIGVVVCNVHVEEEFNNMIFVSFCNETFALSLFEMYENQFQHVLMLWRK